MSFIICVNSNKNDEFPLQKSWKQILKNLKLWHNWRHISSLHISLNILSQCCWKKWIFHFRNIRIQSTYKFGSLFTKRVRTLVFSDIYLTRLVLWKPLFWSLSRSKHLIFIFNIYYLYTKLNSTRMKPTKKLLEKFKLEPDPKRFSKRLNRKSIKGN